MNRYSVATPLPRREVQPSAAQTGLELGRRLVVTGEQRQDASGLDVRDPFNPQESLSAGAKLLKQLLDRYHGDLALALSAYNAGIGRVDRTFTVPEIPETKDYVTDILGRLHK